MTGPEHPRRRGTPFVCKVCGGPCRSNKGSVHGWTCSACLDVYLYGREKRCG